MENWGDVALVCTLGPQEDTFLGGFMVTLVFLCPPVAQESHQEGAEVSGPGYCG